MVMRTKFGRVKQTPLGNAFNCNCPFAWLEEGGGFTQARLDGEYRNAMIGPDLGEIDWPTRDNTYV
jgi:hypothetical protein